jgi:hypothetical protein
MSISVSEKEHVSFAKAEAARDFSNMIPRSNSRSNSVYKIDDLSSLVCDMHKAMEILTPLSLSRLMRYHYEGYYLEEIGEQDGCTKQAILFSLRASYNKMADFLESPKAPVETPAYEYEEYTHKRKYVSPNANHPVR